MNNLSDKQIMIYDYMKNVLQRKFPNVDLSPASVFTDLFVSPHLALLEPILNHLDRLSLMQSIENAGQLTEEEMDLLATRYFVERSYGEKARGVVTFVLKDIQFSDASASRAFTILPGIIATSKQGYRYISIDNIVITDAQLSAYFNTDTYRYEIPVTFESLYSGQIYNVGPNEIVSIDRPVVNLQSVFNSQSFSGGTDKESNLEFAKKIKAYFRAPNLGVKRGYESVIKQQFSDVEDVVAVGFGDPLMKRDVIKILDANNVVKEVHWGSKVDLYIKGSSLSTVSVSLIASSYNAAQTYVDIPVQYSPLYDVVQIQKGTNTSSVVSNYSIVFETDEIKKGSSLEKTRLLFSTSDIPISTQVTVTFRYNDLIRQIDSYINIEENRPPTADVMVKSAVKKYVAGGLVVKSATSTKVSPADKSWVLLNTQNFVNQVPMNSELQFSDLYSELLVESGINISQSYVIDMIQFPTQFLVLDHQSPFIYDCLSVQKQSFLSSRSSAAISILNDYKNKITKTDFFNFLHTVSHSNGLTSVVLDYFDTQSVGDKALFLSVRNSFIRSNAIIDLSPSATTTNINEYFELGHLSIFDYQPYTKEEWQTRLNNAKTSSAVNGNNLHHLTAFLLMIIFVCTKELQPSDFSSHMNNAFSGTALANSF